LDENDAEAAELGVTATVGPTPDDDTNREHTRGVQLTLRTPNGYAYVRVSEQQVRDLIDVLGKRVDSDSGYEATGGDVPITTPRVRPDGSVEGDDE
jgi:hypothetical protein